MTPTLKCQEHTYSEKTGPGRCERPALYEVTFLHAQISGRAKAFMCGKHSAEMVHGSWSIRRSRLPET